MKVEKRRGRMRNLPRCDIWLVRDLEGISVSPVYVILRLKIQNFDAQKNRLNEMCFFRALKAYILT